MNIFILDYNTTLCAQYHNNKHVVKMGLEMCQILCTALWSINIEAPMKPYMKHHPLSAWVLESKDNYIFAVNLGLEIFKEYTHRYNKIHSCEKTMKWLANNIPNIESRGFTFPYLAMPEKYRSGDPVNSYRKYYIGEKLSFCKYKNREIPKWLINYMN